ncbi:hypothetical protein HZC07_04955, partial [Candidatus Micrarchaeota archaeon]|nr:hypothetical protein [Candidatus Micrarchaeota archaeon]
MKYISVLVFIGLMAVCFSSTYTGDGVYKVFVEDQITSTNGFVIDVLPLGTSWGRTQAMIVDNVTLRVTYSRNETETVTLKTGDRYKMSAVSGTQNLSINVTGLGYDPYPGGAPDYGTPYANLSVGSITYVPPAPPPVNQTCGNNIREGTEDCDGSNLSCSTGMMCSFSCRCVIIPPTPPVLDVQVDMVTVTPNLFSAEVTWTTNVSANGTLHLFNSSRSYLMNSWPQASKSVVHTVTVTGLKSDTNYYVYLDNVCTGANNSLCIATNDTSFRTLPVTPVISNVVSKSITNESATITWDSDVTSDSKVYYRKYGTSEWTQVPPPVPSKWADISKYFIDTPIVITPPIYQ